MSMKSKKVGVIMLDTKFPRLVGDIGNPEGFAFPLIYKTVTGATPIKVVEEQSSALLQPYIAAAQELVREGADIVTTSCGFLACFQSEIQSHVAVPVITSSLSMLEDLERQYGEGNVGILTISRASMSPEFLKRSGVPKSTPIGSTENGKEFSQAILSNRAQFDEAQCRKDVIEAALKLVSDHPQVKAIILECTNMPPHEAAIRQATGRSVYSLNTLLQSKAC